MFLRSESESEREQGLGERTRPFRISRMRTLLDNGCEGQPLPCTVTKSWTDGELGTASLLLGFHQLEGLPMAQIKPAR